MNRFTRFRWRLAGIIGGKRFRQHFAEMQFAWYKSQIPTKFNVKPEDEIPPRKPEPRSYTA